MATNTQYLDPRKRVINYPSPWFDIAQTWTPSTVKDLFKWCKYYFYSNPIVNAIIQKISEYPITDLIYEFSEKSEDKKIGSGKSTNNRLKYIFETILNVRGFLIEKHLDFFTYGNAFVSISFPFKRFLVCPNCNNDEPIDTVQYKFQTFNFVYNCKKCSQQVKGIIKDIPTKSPENINFVRWNPENINIDYNPINGKSDYYYRIPNKIKNDIIRGKRYTIEQIPKLFIDAVKGRKDILLSNDNLFHEKRGTLAEEDMGWGKPILLHVLKDVFYLQTLRRAQESIAMQHVVPLDFVSPRATSGVDPYTHIDLSRWKNQILDELSRWRKDPNYISIMPIPVDISRYGGDARVLLITPEIESINRAIAGGLGVPLDFLTGNLSWSGSSVSLRTLENHFLTTRENDHRFFYWLVDKLKPVLNLPADLVLRLSDFKMADDVQRKQLYLNLNANQKLSDDTLLSEFGFEPEIESLRIDKQIKDNSKRNITLAKTQAEANGEAQVVSAQYQERLRKMQKEQIEQMQKEQLNIGQGQEQAMEQTSQEMPTKNVPIDWSAQVKKIVNQVSQMNENDRMATLNRIRSEYPPLFGMIQEYMDKGTINRGAQVNMKPPPEQKPPRRQETSI